ncbi:hypothetical protein NUACC21_20910 [Scytonema sp. NUACC21]
MKRDASGKFVSNWGSETKQRVSLSLTSTAWRSLNEEAQKRGISRSEVIEQVARSFGNERHLDSGERGKQALAERERLLQELETERTRFEAVLRQMPAGVMIADAASGRLVLANEQAKQIVGYAYEQLLELNEYDPLVSYIPFRSDGQPYTHLNMPLARSLKMGEVVTNEEMEIHRDDGSCIFININSAPILDNQGQIVAAVVIFQDVTNSKRVEQALRQSESQLRGLFNANLIGIIVSNSQGYILEVNDAWLNILGYTREEVLSGDVNFHEITPPEFRHLDRQAMVEMKQFGCHTPFEKEYIRKDGTRIPVLIGTAYLGEPDSLEIGFLIDLTERKQIETEREELLKHLQQKERQQQFLIELNDAIRTIKDPKSVMWQVVRATGQHFKVTRCTYGEIDPTQEYVIVDRDFCDGTISVVGKHHMNSFGPEIIAQLKQGKTIVVDNVDVDPRTADSGVAAFNAIQTKSLLCVPLVKEEQFVALFVLHHVSPRHWTEEEVALMERIAEQTWLAVERTRAEESLRESEAHLQLAVKVGRMGTWDWDVQTGALLWSEGHYSVLGLQPYECKPSYEVWASRVHPEDLAQTEVKLQQAMLEKKEYHHEYRMRWSDGSVHWVEARGKFTYDSGGNAKRSIGAVIDITERKQAEQEREQLLERERIARTQVEAAQRQLATIFETSPVGIAWLDTEQRFIAINEALAEINGLTREQHLRYSIPELFGQSDPKLVEVFHQIYTTGNPFISPNFGVNVPGRDDRRPGYYNVYYLPTTNPSHEVEGVLVYVIDVTERVRLEHAQRFLSETSAVLASSLDYQTTLERVAQLTVPELADWCTIHMVEEDGSIEQITVAHTDPAKLQWADQIRRKYPLNPDEPRGAAFTLRTGRSDLLADIPDELLLQAAQDPEHLEILRQVGFKSVMTVPLRTQANIIGVISFIFAETERRYDRSHLQLAEELAYRASLAIENAQLYRVAQRARAKAESANRVKDEFLAVLSHELRSPLNPILGWTKMLRSKRLDTTKVEQALETIERNAKLQAQLIEDLLDVSRILQGKMTLNVVPVNLAATIQAAKETVRLAAEVKSIQIHTTLNPVLGTVLGDTNRIQQIVWNLFSNAVKFTPNGGRVEVQLEQVGTYAQIQVKDTGIGISPEFLPHVFEYFRQEDGTTTRRFGGLGLGLAIVRHLTELHGGTVQAVSPGQNLGATFTIRLPLNAVEPEVSSDRSEQESVTKLTGIQIWIVDSG